MIGPSAHGAGLPELKWFIRDGPNERDSAAANAVIPLELDQQHLRLSRTM
jgi:hypothetical protein